MVFYRETVATQNVGIFMSFLDKMDGTWKVTDDLYFPAADIDSVSFVRLGEKNITHIIVSLGINSSEKRFALVRYSEQKSEILFETAYTYIKSGSFFTDNELLIILKESVPKESLEPMTTLKIGSLDENDNFIMRGEAPLDPNAEEYVSFYGGKIKIDTVREAMFIDYKRPEGEIYGTEVFYFDDTGKLRNPVFETETNMPKTLRRVNDVTEKVNPFDIDGDGVLELCGSGNDFSEYLNLPPNERLYSAVWKDFSDSDSGNVIRDKYISYYSEKYAFAFLFPERWKSKVSVKISDTSAEQRNIVFYTTEYIPERSAPLEIILFSVIVNKDESFKPYDYLCYFKDEYIAYYAKQFNTENPLSLTAEEILNGFKML
jgi:hypothetical protein